VLLEPVLLSHAVTDCENLFKVTSPYGSNRCTVVTFAPCFSEHGSFLVVGLTVRHAEIQVPIVFGNCVMTFGVDLIIVGVAEGNLVNFPLYTFYHRLNIMSTVVFLIKSMA
jgi:hypothetical protein